MYSCRICKVLFLVVISLAFMCCRTQGQQPTESSPAQKLEYTRLARESAEFTKKGPRLIYLDPLALSDWIIEVQEQLILPGGADQMQRVDQLIALAEGVNRKNFWLATKADMLLAINFADVKCDPEKAYLLYQQLGDKEGMGRSASMAAQKYVHLYFFGVADPCYRLKPVACFQQENLDVAQSWMLKFMRQKEIKQSIISLGYRYASACRVMDERERADMILKQLSQLEAQLKNST